MPEDEPSLKTRKLISLAEILHLAVFTGEYRDAADRRRPSAAFQQEVREAIDDIFAEEIGNIRAVAAREREILKRDAEIMYRKAVGDMGRDLAVRLAKLEESIRRIFREASDPETAAKAVEKAVKDMGRHPPPDIKPHEQEFEKSRRAGLIRMELAFQDLLEKFINPK